LDAILQALSPVVYHFKNLFDELFKLRAIPSIATLRIL
jgi:hypothetical protein